MHAKTILATLLAVLSALCCAPLMAATLVIPGSNTGPIPDGDLSGRTISFSVASDATVSTARLQLTLSHSWVGDLAAVLRSPGGAAQLVVFSRVGSGFGSGFGDNSNLSGRYEFSDVGADFWQAAATAPDTDSVIAENTYRTSTAGMPNLSDHGGCFSSLGAAFGERIPQSGGVAAGGVWTLNIVDSVTPDSGDISIATLILEESGRIFADGFENLAAVPGAPAGSVGAGSCTETVHDLTGNGLADYITVSDNAGSLEWSVLENAGNGTSGAIMAFQLGSAATDFWNTADIDGDGIYDATVFTPSTGVFRSRLSSRPGSPPLQAYFGPMVSGESRNPIMLGDYDGDGLDEFAVQTQPSPGVGRLDYVRSSNGAHVTFNAGDNSINFIRSSGGYDFSGDGLADLIQAQDGNFIAYRGSDGIVVEGFAFSDTTVPVLYSANRNGDERADVTAVSVSGSDVLWETRTTGSGATSTPEMFGALVPGFATFSVAADYDGDGLLDYAYWLRDNSGSGPSQFFVRPSSNPAATWTVDQGGMGDAPVTGGSRTY